MTKRVTDQPTTSTPPGHVFVVRGLLESIACDAVIVPTSSPGDEACLSGPIAFYNHSTIKCQTAPPLVVRIVVAQCHTAAPLAVRIVDADTVSEVADTNSARRPRRVLAALAPRADAVERTSR